MDMPGPTEAHKKLETFAGNWSGTENMHPSPWAPEGTTATGYSKSRVDLDGFVVISDYHQENEGKTTYSGHGIYTYDQKAQCVALYWFDCMGTKPNVFRGTFEGETITLISDESTEGGPHFSRFHYDLGTPGKMTYSMEVSENGEDWKTFVDGTYTGKD